MKTRPHLCQRFFYHLQIWVKFLIRLNMYSRYIVMTVQNLMKYLLQPKKPVILKQSWKMIWKNLRTWMQNFMISRLRYTQLLRIWKKSVMILQQSLLQHSKDQQELLQVRIICHMQPQRITILKWLMALLILHIHF